jgi:prepilin-type processing-associated H-X9-DG protein
LAAILFPVFAQAREKARQIACLSNCRQIGMALTLYCNDWDEKYPQEHPSTGNPAVDDNSGQLEQIDYGSPFDKILSYVGGHDASKQKLYTCPSDPDPAGATIPNCVGSSPGPLGSYVINAYYLFGATLAQIQEPADSIYIAERSTAFCDVHYHPWLGEVDQPPSNGATFALAAQRHSGGSNYVYADGHAKWRRFESTRVPFPPDHLQWGQHQAF